jgi:hypothetical protein
MDRERIGIPSICAFALLVGCYSPNINQGAFTCGPNRACPDNYHCAANNRCYSINVDAAVEKPVCTSFSLPPICSVQPASGEQCNPGCQTGCDCGWCGVVNGAATCLQGTAGTIDVGDVCVPSSNDCKAGLYCQPESCGTNTGRCYQLCDPSVGGSCGNGSSCSQAIAPAGATTLPFKLCSLVISCDPIGQMSTSCPAPFACYPLAGLTTECSCPGVVATSGGCGGPSDCVSGDSCIGVSPTSSICLPTCNDNSQCTGNTQCQNNSPTTYGFCR